MYNLVVAEAKVPLINDHRMAIYLLLLDISWVLGGCRIRTRFGARRSMLPVSGYALVTLSSPNMSHLTH